MASPLATQPCQRVLISYKEGCMLAGPTAANGCPLGLVCSRLESTTATAPAKAGPAGRPYALRLTILPLDQVVLRMHLGGR